MEILFEIFQLKEPEWTDDFHAALLSVGEIKIEVNSPLISLEVLVNSDFMAMYCKLTLLDFEMTLWLSKDA